MTYHTESEKVDGAIAWSESADSPESFDNSFLISLQNRLGTRELTDAQISALDNIISRFKINIGDYL